MVHLFNGFTETCGENVKTGLSLNGTPFRKFCKLLKQKKKKTHTQNTLEFDTKLNTYLISNAQQGNKP